MPISRIVATPRAKAALMGVTSAVALATGVLIKPWEATKLYSYRDQLGIWTGCTGETKGMGPGMKFTPAECEEMLQEAVEGRYHVPLTKCIPGFDKLPISLGASLISGAYNHGAQSMCNSTAAKLARAGKYREACEAATAFNRGGGQVINGLVKRREMGDRERIGEAELCVSGL